MRLRRCPHDRVRCIHGDEINQAMTYLDALTGAPARRARCLDCGRALIQDLPEPCTFTGVPHEGAA